VTHEKFESKVLVFTKIAIHLMCMRRSRR